ncbi:finTRIM family, member 14, partial [Silurus asotus]
KMAESTISVVQLSVNQFRCSVCLDLLKDPVAIPCGHSFCKVCINDSWDHEDWIGVYSCPLCRHTFNPRPVLHRNNMLEEVVEKLKNSEAQAAHYDAGPGDVECDLCSGGKRKAVKSCLMCLVSFCETHLKPHYEVPSWKKHTLIEASGNLQEKICSEHDKLVEIYCRTDQSFICYLCTMHEHRGHDTVAAAAERAEKQTQLKEEQMKFQQRIQEKQKKVQELKGDVNIIKLSAQTAVEDSEKIFTEMISSIEKKYSEVMDLIRDQEKAELNRPERLLEQQEQEISDLQGRVNEMEQLSHTHDHIHFLQVTQSVIFLHTFIASLKGRGDECVFGCNNQSWSLECSSSSFCFWHNNNYINHKVPSSSRIGVYVDHSAGILSFYSVSDRMKLLHRVHTTFTQPLYAGLWIASLPSSASPGFSAGISSAPPSSHISTVLLQLSYSIRSVPLQHSKRTPTALLQFFYSIPTVPLQHSYSICTVPLQYSYSTSTVPLQYTYSIPTVLLQYSYYFCNLTLDPNTVNYNLILSEKNKVVTRSETMQSYSDQPERFDFYRHVLSKESVCGRCYWEVEWRIERNVYISVSYKHIRRKGRGDKCVFGHNNQSWRLECFCSSVNFWHNKVKTDLKVPASSRIGVYVDHSVGTLSFYSVSDMIKLLHRLHTTFTQPLYAGFWLKS